MKTSGKLNVFLRSTLQQAAVCVYNTCILLTRPAIPVYNDALKAGPVHLRCEFITMLSCLKITTVNFEYTGEKHLQRLW